jgi:hypothetical protein
MTSNQDSDFEIERQLPHMILTYFAAIDEKQLNLTLYKSLFSETGAIVRPNGPVKGASAIYESQNESFKRFRATQHVVTNMLFTKTGVGWKLRANLQAMHLWIPEMQDSNSLDSYFLAQFESGHAAKERRNSNRPSCVIAQAQWRHASRNGNSLATAASTRRPGWVPHIDCVAI